MGSATSGRSPTSRTAPSAARRGSTASPENGQYIAAVTTGGQAALYSTSGTLLGSYWNGEATFVNDSGLVVGDTTTIDGGGGNSNPRAMAYLDGNTVDLTTAYAPAGVTFKACDGVNDAGQILVSNSYSVATGVEMWLLTPALPGDANLDGKVNINDLTIVLAHYNQTGMTWAQGDFTGDGTVDINDLTIVLAHYNQTAGSSAAGMAAVPEPASAALLAFGGLSVLLGLAWRRRASRSRCYAVVTTEPFHLAWMANQVGWLEPNQRATGTPPGSSGW